MFYGLPWLEWGQRQAVLFDLGARRFYIFGLVLYPQDFIYLTGIHGDLGPVTVPLYRRRRATVVWLCLPTDGLYRDISVDREEDRG
jgi:polyferredoxin